MNPYSDKMKKYLSEKQPNYGDEDIRSLIEFLYSYYAELNPMQTEEIRMGFDAIFCIASRLSREELDDLFTAINDLCLKLERTAFREGFCVGARLITELYDTEWEQRI